MRFGLFARFPMAGEALPIPNAGALRPNGQYAFSGVRCPAPRYGPPGMIPTPDRAL